MPRCASSIGLACMLVAARASAADLPCAPAEPGTISLDGMADDWHEVQPLTAGDANAGVALRCNVEGKTLYLSVEATDNYVVRTTKAVRGEDHLSLHIGSKSFLIFPAADGAHAKITPGGAKLASTANDKGFVVELAMPLASLGGGRNPERLDYTLAFDDCDAKAKLSTERSVTLKGEVTFTAGPSTLDSFLEDRHLPRSAIHWKHLVRTGKGSGQLIVAGKYVAIVGDGYGYIELPVGDGKDVQAPQLVDLAGDGHAAVLLRYTERSEAGAREVLAAFRADGAAVKRVFAAEVGKQTASGKLSTKVSLKRRGKATDVVLEAARAQGLTAETYKEAPAEDIVPILLPWEKDRRATFRFSGDSFQRK